MRISDLSSDVFSSALHSGPSAHGFHHPCRPVHRGSNFEPRNHAGDHFRSIADTVAPPRAADDFHLRRRQVRPGTRRFYAVASRDRSEEHTSELQSLMRISYAVFCLKKKKNNTNTEY